MGGSLKFEPKQEIGPASVLLSQRSRPLAGNPMNEHQQRAYHAILRISKARTSAHVLHGKGSKTEVYIHLILKPIRKESMLYLVSENSSHCTTIGVPATCFLVPVWHLLFKFPDAGKLWVETAVEQLSG